MPTQSLAINELVMLLALDDSEGKVRWSVSPYLDYALAGGMLAELALRGILDFEGEENLILVKAGTRTESSLLNEVIDWFQKPEHPDSISGWISAVSTMPDLDHRQMEELVAKGILEKKAGHFLFIFPMTKYPALDHTPEKEVVARIREAVLGNDPVARQLAILITIAHGAHLLRGPLTDKELEHAEPRLLEIAKGNHVAEATFELIQQAERALYIASSIPFMGISRF